MCFKGYGKFKISCVSYKEPYACCVSIINHPYKKVAVLMYVRMYGILCEYLHVFITQYARARTYRITILGKDRQGRHNYYAEKKKRF